MPPPSIGEGSERSPKDGNRCCRAQCPIFTGDLAEPGGNHAPPVWCLGHVPLRLHPGYTSVNKSVLILLIVDSCVCMWLPNQMLPPKLYSWYLRRIDSQTPCGYWNLVISESMGHSHQKTTGCDQKCLLVMSDCVLRHR